MRIIKIFGVVFVFLLTQSLFAEYKPDFQAGTMLKYTNGQPVDGAGTSASTVYDWDGDGKKDILIGIWKFEKSLKVNDSRIHFLKNVGTDNNPEFASSTILKDENGADIVETGE